MVESTYNALNLVFTWFSLANFYIFFVSYMRTLLMTGHLDQCSGGGRFQHSEHQHSQSYLSGMLRVWEALLSV